MSESLNFAGEFGVEDLRIVTPNGEAADLISDVLVSEINIFEDIFKNSITGSIMLIDIRDIITLLPIQGEEELYLKLKTPSLNEKEDIIDFTETPFIINKVSLRQEVSSGGQIYELTFTSPEAIKNTRKRISKSYVNTKANIGEIVDDLMTGDSLGIKTQKEVFIEPTLGTRKYIVPNSYPFTFIKKLTKEAISESGSPHYLFFENKNGFHFKTLQFLYKEGQEKGVRGEFHVGDKGFDEESTPDPDSGKLAQSLKRVIEYSIKDNKDLLVSNTSGLLGGKVLEYNLYGKKINTKTFNYFDDADFDKHERIVSNKVYSINAVPSLETLNDDQTTDANIHVIPVSKDGETDKNYESGTPNQRDKTILQRKSRLVEYQNGISINMTIHGQTTLTVGDMVTVSIPAVGSEDEVEDKNYSGAYLITKLRHTFDLPTRNHVVHMQLVKDGLGESLGTSEPATQIPPQKKSSTFVKPNSGPR